MSDVLIGIAVIWFALSWIGGVAAFFAILVYGFMAVSCTRQGVKPWGRETWWNPANVLLRPSLLTEEGRAYRRKCFLAMGVFVVCTGVPLGVAELKGKLL